MALKLFMISLEALSSLTKPAYFAIALILYILFRALYQIVLYPHVLSPLHRVPSPPLDSYLLGHFPAIMRSEAGIIQREWVKQHGPTVRAIGPVGIERLIMLKPEAQQKILVSDWMEYPRPAFMRSILGLAAGYGLLTVTGNEHKQMRKVMNPAFSISNLMAQTDLYYDSTEVLIEILNTELSSERDLSQGKVFPIYEWMSKVTLDIICDTAFGYRSNSLRDPHNELTEALLIGGECSGPNISLMVLLVSIPGLPQLMNSEWGYKHRHWLSYWSLFAPAATFIDSVYRIRKISARILKNKIAEAQAVCLKDTVAKKDIMSLLVRARKVEEHGREEDDYKLTDEALVDQVLTFLGAGHETTASGLSWTLWLLANDPATQSKLRAEVSPLLERNPRPDYRSLKDLKLLDCVVMESLRLLPPVPMTFRQAAKSDWVDGYWVPKDSCGQYVEGSLGRRRGGLPPRAVDVVVRVRTGTAGFTFMSFIAGPHACIGRTMSIVEMKAVLATLIAKFEFEPAYEGQIAKPTAAVTMKPADNMPLLIKRVQPDVKCLRQFELCFGRD
ncbi:hypothetical protein EW146_g3696 [Bondarzewia mesenterica]|uniref:Cytochrome P450 n=1 Tax=Bondarzewia mesenterica TaxID=1095465 RepID=A0A4S4LXB5_9AGAM|nr:hypothetical protein EW146_g3696 [Bondarzewia mesenterica]